MSTVADSTAETGGETEDIRDVPQDAGTRSAIRKAAKEVPEDDWPAASDRDTLISLADDLLHDLSLSRRFLGFAMIALDNAFWRKRFLAVSPDRRLLLLPKCLSDSERCQGTYDSEGLHCAGCGCCVINDLKADAEALGYSVIIAEGTSSALMHVLQGKADAILGVACMDSMHRSFERVTELGVPHQAIPLLTDGCVDTTADLEIIRALLGKQAGEAATAHRSYLPLLRHARSLFEDPEFGEIIATCACPSPDKEADEALMMTDRIARDWLQRGGKRFRPFVTLAAYAAGAHGAEAVSSDVNVKALLGGPVEAVAVAIEALHKASLVHDDIEDGDTHRYGEPTVHEQYGIETAINVGDYLIGLGYRLIARSRESLGAECVADILERLSSAHLQLCCGQGTELWHDGGCELRPVDALQIGALKTAPAFEVALYAGLRAADVPFDTSLLRRFATFVGEAYQVANDLNDWDDDDHKDAAGTDAVAKRPTILRAFALQAKKAAVTEAFETYDGAELSGRLHELYEKLGAFERAEVLYRRLRERSLELSEDIGDTEMQHLMQFLVRSLLPDRSRLTGVHSR